MKYCTKCGTELNEKTRFCPGCGLETNKKVEKAHATKLMVNDEQSMNDSTNKQAVLVNLVMIGAMIMLLGLFIGNFYTASNGAYAGGYVVKGYNVITSIWYGFLLVLIPIMLLIAPKIESLSKVKKLIDLVLPIVSLVIIFILKGQIADAISIYGSSTSSFGAGAYLYMIGNILCLTLGAAAYFGFQTDARSLQKALNERSFDSLKGKEKE